MTSGDMYLVCCRPSVPAGRQLCGEDAGADPGPALPGVRGTGRSCARGPAEVWSPAGQTDRAEDAPSQLPPAEQTAAWTLTQNTHTHTRVSSGSFLPEFKDVGIRDTVKTVWECIDFPSY